ncbi:hypothetical protein L9F63_023755, partial [Diploptera punctata]
TGEGSRHSGQSVRDIYHWTLAFIPGQSAFQKLICTYSSSFRKFKARLNSMRNLEENLHLLRAIQKILQEYEMKFNKIYGYILIPGIDPLKKMTWTLILLSYKNVLTVFPLLLSLCNSFEIKSFTANSAFSSLSLTQISFLILSLTIPSRAFVSKHSLMVQNVGLSVYAINFLLLQTLYLRENMMASNRENHTYHRSTYNESETLAIYILSYSTVYVSSNCQQTLVNNSNLNLHSFVNKAIRVVNDASTAEIYNTKLSVFTQMLIVEVENYRDQKQFLNGLSSQSCILSFNHQEIGNNQHYIYIII